MQKQVTTQTEVDVVKKNMKACQFPTFEVFLVVIIDRVTSKKGQKLSVFRRVKHVLFCGLREEKERSMQPKQEGFLIDRQKNGEGGFFRLNNMKDWMPGKLNKRGLLEKSLSDEHTHTSEKPINPISMLSKTSRACFWKRLKETWSNSSLSLCA